MEVGEGRARTIQHDRVGAARARLVLNFSLATFTTGLLVGAAWDVYWHSQHSFETFFSSPHLLIYAGISSAGLFAVSATFRPDIVGRFGAPLQLAGLRLRVPANVLLLGVGVLLALCGGVLDNWWHSLFGLDETRWTLPHGLVAWAVFVVLLGYLSCRISPSVEPPISELGRAAFGALLLAYSFAIFLGPFFLGTTAAAMQQASSLPGFQASETQHSFRLAAQWNLYRTSVFFPALVGVWAGVFVGIARGLSPRPRGLLIAIALGTAIVLGVQLLIAAYMGTLTSPSTWLPPMLLPAAVVLVFIEKAWSRPVMALFVSGAVLGALTALSYGVSLDAMLLSVLAAGTLPLGHRTGQAAWRIVKAPTFGGVRGLVLCAGIAVPVVLGALDLYLRMNTP